MGYRFAVSGRVCVCMAILLVVFMNAVLTEVVPYLCEQQAITSRNGMDRYIMLMVFGARSVNSVLLVLFVYANGVPALQTTAESRPVSDEGRYWIWPFFLGKYTDLDLAWYACLVFPHCAIVAAMPPAFGPLPPWSMVEGWRSEDSGRPTLSQLWRRL